MSSDTKSLRRVFFEDTTIRGPNEDLQVISSWFTLVQNTIAKYGIVESDIYNFNETGFIMGIISTGIVVTSVERRSNTKLV